MSGSALNISGLSWRNVIWNKNVEKKSLSASERELIREYLRSKDYRWKDLRKLPHEETKYNMKQACQYASLKHSEIEAKK